MKLLETRWPWESELHGNCTAEYCAHTHRSKTFCKCGVYPKGSEGEKQYRSVMHAGQIFLLPSLGLGIAAFVMRCLSKTEPLWMVALKGVFLSIWTIGVPLWFLYEYFNIFPDKGRVEYFEQFKYGQELASKVWLGVAAVLTGLYYGKLSVGG